MRLSSLFSVSFTLNALCFERSILSVLLALLSFTVAIQLMIQLLFRLSFVCSYLFEFKVKIFHLVTLRSVRIAKILHQASRPNLYIRYLRESYTID